MSYSVKKGKGGKERKHCIAQLPDSKFAEIMQCYHKLGASFSLIYQLIYVRQIELIYMPHFSLIKRRITDF